MAVSITAIREASRQEWEQACRECGHATFFHTPHWAALFSASGRGRIVPAAERVEFSDGASAVMPIVYKWYLLRSLRLYWSMPAGTCGGWVSADALTEAHARLLVARLDGIRDLVWRENPYDPLLRAIELPCSADDFTQAIDLRQGLAAAEARADHAHRKAVRKAREKGVVAVEASDFGQWKSYFSLYQDSRRRWKERNLPANRGYDRAFFDLLYRSPAEHRRLWLAQVDGTPVAGILCFYWNRHAVAWLGAGAADHFGCRPNNLLYEHAVRHAAGAGYHWFDCNPSAGLKGVVEFKEHLGAQKLQSRVVNRRSFLRRAAESLRGIVR
ncbi:MAG: GNAT family N-acetyltransferase [Chitinispirillaceae bacterium]|nr:GNAT family N-acetyltransferase [Chitinispirillaceae bacterium]